MEQNQPLSTSTKSMNRREWFAAVLMTVGLVASYGTLAAQALAFLLPRRLQVKTRKIFAGSVDNYPVGSVQTVTDLEGNAILIKRSTDGFKAYSSTCPHLGCKVHWQAAENQFFCPCHSGTFDADGKGIAGPPADAGQSLAQVPLTVDERSGVVYLEVKEPKRKASA